MTRPWVVLQFLVGSVAMVMLSAMLAETNVTLEERSREQAAICKRNWPSHETKFEVHPNGAGFDYVCFVMIDGSWVSDAYIHVEASK